MKKIIVLSILFVLFFVSKSYCLTQGFAWDAVVSSDLAGYRLYQSQTPGVYDKATQKVADVSKTNTIASVTISLNNGETLYFVATAYDTKGNESGFSNEVSLTVPDGTPPGNPKNFRFTTTITMYEDGSLSFTNPKLTEIVE